MTFYQSAVLFHVCTAVIGIIAGGVSMMVRKGSGLHRAAGDIFVIAMLSMAAAGAFIAAFLKPNIGNVMGGTLTFYLVGTAWMAGRRREKKVSAFDYTALAMISAMVVAEMILGAAAIRRGSIAGYPPYLFFIVGAIAALFAMSDVRMIVRGGIAGAPRLVRHVVRMSFAFLIALLSFYPSRARLFSQTVNDSHLLYIPHVLVFGAAMLWIARLSRRRKEREYGTDQTRRTDRRPLVSVAADGAV